MNILIIIFTFILLLLINITNNYNLNLVFKTLFFALVLSRLKHKDNFTVCPPGFKIRDASNSIFDPNRSWCEYSGQKKTDELIENDSDEDEEEEEYQEDEDRIKAKTKVCGRDSKYIEDSYYEDRKSWCELNN
jgi:hypothetical protein